MALLTIKLPPQRMRTEFNMRRWTELLADPELSRIENRIETDRYGHVIMSPPPASKHGRLQARIAVLLDRNMAAGEILTECPISTADGVRAADVAWASAECIRELGDSVCFPRAPEICVEVVSPGDTTAELQEKMALYFDAGAKEVWLCAESAEMRFHGSAATKPMPRSKICPAFPTRVPLRSA
jgi:Uma2 family endonuclease